MRNRTAVAAALSATVAVMLTACQPAVQDGADPTPAAATPTTSTSPSPATQPAPHGAAHTPDPRPPFDRTRLPTDDPTSTWFVVNKRLAIRPLGYRPDLGLVRGYQVARPAVGPLTRLLDAGDDRGLGLKIASAFRSAEYQAMVHASTVAARGRAAADRVSARPGHSEHQTGLAVDIVTPATPACDFEACFADTRAGRWLATHAWRYGFVVRYQAGDTAITGYQPEPWHLRYVGRPLAAELRRTGITTLEEFFDLPGARP